MVSGKTWKRKAANELVRMKSLPKPESRTVLGNLLQPVSSEADQSWVVI